MHIGADYMGGDLLIAHRHSLEREGLIGQNLQTENHSPGQQSLSQLKNLLLVDGLEVLDLELRLQVGEPHKEVKVEDIRQDFGDHCPIIGEVTEPEQNDADQDVEH